MVLWPPRDVNGLNAAKRARSAGKSQGVRYTALARFEDPLRGGQHGSLDTL